MPLSPDLDSTVGMPMHFEAGGVSSEMLPAPPTVEHESKIRLAEARGGVALTASEISVEPVPPIVPISELRPFFKRQEAQDALRQAS